MARGRLALLLGLLSGHLSANGGAALAESPQVPAAAEHSAPVRLLVIESVPEFSARVRGQVSDLDLSLEVEAGNAFSTHADVEAFVAERAALRDADVVAWLGALAGESPSAAQRMTVYVWIVGHERVHARRVGPQRIGAGKESARDSDNAHSLTPRAAPASHDERSATLEAAALVVRSAVRAVAFERENDRAATENGASSGSESSFAAAHAAAPAPERASTRAVRLEAPRLEAVPAPEAVFLPEAGPPLKTAARLAADDGVDESSKNEPHPVRWSPRAGIDWSHAGLKPGGFWSASAGLELHSGALSGGARASWGFVEPLVYRGVAFELDRRALLAEVGWAFVNRPSFVLRPKLGAGAAWLTRNTRATAWNSGLAPARTSWSPLVSGELVAEYRLAEQFTLDLHGGLRWLAHTTRYVVESPNGSVPLAAGWRWQPNVGIALGAVF